MGQFSACPINKFVPSYFKWFDGSSRRVKKDILNTFLLLKKCSHIYGVCTVLNSWNIFCWRHNNYIVI